MLGILEPRKGQIFVSGEPVRSAISRWPGAVAYVPQNVMVIEGSIANNIALGYDEDSINKQYVREALQIAQLWEFVDSLPNGIETKLIFTTTGSILSRMTGNDPLLSNYSCIIVDEAHERSVETDQLLLLLKKVCLYQAHYFEIFSSICEF